MDKELLSGIIENCKNGDKQSFKLLMLDLTDYVFALAFRILANEEDAQDVVQETFINVWKNIEKYRSEIKITTWIYTITTNLCLDKIRINRRKSLVFSPNFEKTFNTLVSDNGGDNFDNKQLVEIIAHLAEKLTPKQKIVFVLKDLEGLESEEIEQITGMDKVQIKSNLYCARQQIKNKLIQTGYEVR
jgi:RNA polymerase sigma-70 factor, ECF subfamily